MKAPRPLDLTLRQLEYIVAVADSGSFGAAAEACAVAQPSMSAQVARVEEVVGVALFERSRPVRVTHEGERVIAQAREVLRAARALEDLGRELGDPDGGDLHVGLIPTFAPYLLPRVHPRLREVLPRLAIHWEEAKTADLEAMLADGRLDVALIADRPSNEGLAWRVVGREAFVAVLPGAGTVDPVRLADLSGYEMLLLDDGHCLRDQTVAVCRKHALSPSPFHATSLPTLVQMVAAGVGATLLPRCATSIETAHANVHARSLVEDVGRDAVLVWRRSFPRQALIARVGDELVALFAASAP